MNKIKLNLGCGVAIRKGYINVDNYLDEKDLKSKKGWYRNAVWEKGGKFVKADILKMPFPDNYADHVEMHQVLEHFSFRLVVPALKEIYRVMKPGAKMVMDVPNFNGLALDWIKMNLDNNFDFEKYISIMETIVGNQAGDGEIHKCCFTPTYLNICITAAGFSKGIIEGHEKGSQTPQRGELEIGKKGSTLRHDILIAIVTK